MTDRQKKRLKIGIFLVLALVVTYFLSGNKVVNPMDDDIVHMDAGEMEEEKENVDLDKDKEEDKEETEEEEIEEEVEEKEEPEEEVVAPKGKEKLVEKAKEVPKEKVEEIKKDQKAEKDKIIAQDTNKGNKDKYLTDPVPEGKPKPVEWQDVEIDKSKPMTATLSVTCKSILNNMHLFNMDKIEVLPENGVIYSTREVTFYEGESVFDVLLREMKNNKIHMEFEMTPVYNSHYIQGINNLYEFDCGELSGWMYRVNGWFPNYGASRYLLEDGDKIEWIYTCDLGRDIGGGMAIGGE